MSANLPMPIPAPVPVPAPAPPPQITGPRQPNKLRKKVSFAASAKSAKSANNDNHGGVSDDGDGAAGRGDSALPSGYVGPDFQSPAQRTAAWLSSLGAKKGLAGESGGHDGDATIKKKKEKGTEKAMPGAGQDKASSAQDAEIARAIAVMQGTGTGRGLAVDTPAESAESASAGSGTGEPYEPTWKHHDRYFPLFSESDIFGAPAPSSSPPPPAAAALSRSGLTTTSPNSPYTFTSPFQDALTIVEAQALQHASLLGSGAEGGRGAVLHYPALPAFDEFLQGKSRENVGWKEPQWGTQGCTGYGWAGEVLPDDKGCTFGRPMPEALAVGPDGEVVPKKADGGGGGGGAAAGGASGGAGASAGGEGGGGGAEAGGGKKKKKK